MGCGSALSVHGGPSPVSSAAPKARYRLMVASAVAVVLALGVGTLGWREFTRRAAAAPEASRVTEALGRPAQTGPVTDRPARVADTGPITDRAAVPAPPQPTDVIDYLEFLRDIESRRVQLARSQLGEATALNVTLAARNLSAHLAETEADIAQQLDASYGEFQRKLSEWPREWDELSQAFLSRPAPTACVRLRDLYYDVLGRTAGSIVGVGLEMSRAMAGIASGHSDRALEAVAALKARGGGGMGSWSQEISDACRRADEELDAVCRRFGIRKTFDIVPDGGGASLFGR
ncbi:MAG TPA: hypothetical protein VLH79_01125 [Chthonomonadales bacterium]|nr:hypothetical protein [Chthonomonadales bacterium]